jgi:hypothetical protein
MTHTPLRAVRDEWTDEDWDEFWTIVELSPRDKDRRPFDWALPLIR